MALNRYAAEMPAIESGFDASAAAEKTFIMTKKLMGLVAGIVVIGGSAMLFAQEGIKPANVGEGTLMLKGKNYPLKNAAAYETSVDGEEGIAVVLSGPAISGEKLNEARKSEKKGESSDFRRPYVKLEFTKAGEFKGWGAGAGDILWAGIPVMRPGN